VRIRFQLSTTGGTNTGYISSFGACMTTYPTNSTLLTFFDTRYSTMRSIFALASLASFILWDVNALVLEERSTPGVISVPITRSLTTNKGHPKLKRITPSAILKFDGSIYTMAIAVGTPPQKMTVQLDTGSSDLILETPSSNICKKTPTVCSSHGSCKAIFSTRLDLALTLHR
jgi:Eukaryotic aspartyl protease